MPYTVIPGARVDIKMWTDPNGVEFAAMNQLRNIANLPWVYGLSVMPDVHYGKGATVGSVIAMRDAVSPAAVGVDIGCGMSAVRTSLKAEDLPEDLKAIRSAIEAAIPVGFSVHDNPVNVRRLHGLFGGWDTFWGGFRTLHEGVQKLEDRAHKQLGTLGGGNHFVEWCLDTTGQVWLMLHSGSRNIGKELAERHISVAKTLEHNQVLPDKDLAVFLAGTPEMDAYRRDLYWAQEYARRNRAVMLHLLQDVTRRFFPHVKFDEPISAHHNYVSEETYDGVNVVVTRKGAIRAGKGDLGIIPGSMGTASFIVRGLGNEAAFNSASHGAGRKMSRGQAKRMFTQADIDAQLAGVESRRDEGIIDELPQAYKPIEEVMEYQSDLVAVVAQLKQVICVKG